MPHDSLATPNVGGAKRRLRREEASRYLKEQHGYSCAQRTLAKLACIGGGPLFCLAGRFPLYEPSDLDDWARSKISPRVHSTSELRAVSDA